MKLKIFYVTKERQRLSNVTHTNVYQEAEIEPVRLYRCSVGSVGAARNRFYYLAEFNAPENAEFSRNGLLREYINRLKNPHFKPKDFSWIGDKAELTQKQNRCKMNPL